MAPRTRRLAFGVAAVLIVAGFAAIPLSHGVTGDVIGFALFSVGLIAVIALGFLEVGLSEDRQRAGTPSGAVAGARVQQRHGASQPACSTATRAGGVSSATSPRGRATRSA